MAGDEASMEMTENISMLGNENLLYTSVTQEMNNLDVAGNQGVLESFIKSLAKIMIENNVSETQIGSLFNTAVTTMKQCGDPTTPIEIILNNFDYTSVGKYTAITTFIFTIHLITIVQLITRCY